MKRSYDEMMELIMSKADTDERIRAVTMEGSRANPKALHDELSDFDICYYVSDIREFAGDKEWIRYFGDILIMQTPCDDFLNPYDYSSRNEYNYLMQFTDGNRIDLTLKDISNIGIEPNNTEPRLVLLNKDNFKELFPLDSESGFYISKPCKAEFDLASNEFRWLSLYVMKGLKRKQLYYAKYIYDCIMVEQFIKMLNWKIGIENDFSVTTGSASKYLKKYLSPEEMERFASIFPGGDYEEIWERLFIMYDYFAELCEFVAEKLGFYHDKDETLRVRKFLEENRI